MIWGKTDKEKSERIIRCKQWFAWRPVKLEDGRWCWWEKIWAMEWEHWGRFGVDYYFTIPENKS